MMVSRQIRRFFHINTPFWSVSKSDLAALRKKTGYSFANCKKALEMNPNFEAAEKWLKEQAQNLGWVKAGKLEGRKTSQGLIGITVRDNYAVILEVNCETDFVARNQKFKSFVELSVDSCLSDARKIPSRGNLCKIILDSNEFRNITGPEDKSLADHAALAIADLGENLNLRRAIYINSPTDIHLAVYAHPNPEKVSRRVLTGKYGALVAYVADSNDVQRQQLAEQLCQHVVGMNPKKIGVAGEDEASPNKEDEPIMIHQEFLLDPELTAGQFMANAGLKVIDFVRVECGEELENEKDTVPVSAKAVG